jgi:hypothetical protein
MGGGNERAATAHVDVMPAKVGIHLLGSSNKPLFCKGECRLAALQIICTVRY